MSRAALHLHDHVVVEREHLSQVLAYLKSSGYQLIGPTVREQAIVYDTLNSLDDLPAGLVLYAIEGKSFATGVGLSAEIQSAVQEVARQVERDLA